MTIKIFFSYAQEDEALLNKLKIYLRPLQQEHLIDMWNDRDISVGTDWEREIDKHLNMAQIILLLISQYSLNSDYFYSIETQRAIELHERGEARVIPIILRPVYYQKTPFAMFKVLPEDAKPVTTWRDQDKAFKNVAEGIRKVVNELSQHYGTSEETKDKLLIEGNNFYNAKRYEEALAAFDRALALDPKNTDGWYAKGT